MKLRIALMFLKQAAVFAADLLEDKDENSTGLDDDAAKWIRHFIEGLDKFGL